MAQVPQAGHAEVAGDKNDRQVPPQGPPQNQAGQYGPLPLPMQPAAPAPAVGLADIHAQAEEVIRNTVESEVGPMTRPLINKGKSSAKEVEVCATELIPGCQAHTCWTLKLSKT